MHSQKSNTKGQSSAGGDSLTVFHDTHFAMAMAPARTQAAANKLMARGGYTSNASTPKYTKYMKCTAVKNSSWP